MKILLRCKNPHTPAGEVCHVDLIELFREHNHQVHLDAPSGYLGFDAVFFMAYDEDVAGVKRENPNAIVVLCDPKTENIAAAIQADLLLVSSPEQRDLFVRWNPNCHIYWMFPMVAGKGTDGPIRSRSEPLVITYHGNKVHLNSIFKSVSPAIEALATEMPLVFRVIYNIDKLGKWSAGLPKESASLRVDHIQWSPENLHSALLDTDIGIVPNDMPIPKWARFISNTIFFRKIFLENDYDYFQRYKYSSNPGRIWVYAQYGIPVIADFFPSAAIMLGPDSRGLLAHSAEGWHWALRALACNPVRRRQMGAELRQWMGDKFSRVARFASLVTVMKEIQKANQSNHGRRTKGGELHPKAAFIDLLKENAWRWKKSMSRKLKI